MSRLLYLDTSALTKLVAEEPESAALRAGLADWPDLVSSALAEVELRRAVARMPTAADLANAVERVLASISVIPVTPAVLASAGSLAPPELRTPDAIHLATMLLIADELGAVAVDDRRLADAAGAAGLTLYAPGAAT